jgi:hypothetical protein
MWPDSQAHVNVLIETFQDRHKPINGETVKLHLANAGKVGGGNACQVFGFTHGKSLVVENTDNLGGQ